MRVLQYERYGGPEVLHVCEQPVPLPGPRDVVIRVQAATVGWGDCKARAGLLQNFYQISLPKIPGRYGSGSISTIGSQVDHVKIGDDVVFAPLHTDSGSAAEYVRVGADKIAAKPANLSHIETASMIQGATSAYACLVQTAEKAGGEQVLVHGAAGSVGSACTELAAHLGGIVTATCREADRDYVTRLGASRIVAFDQVAFYDVVRDQSIVVDLLGGEVQRRSYRVLKRRGRLVYLNADPVDVSTRPAHLDIRNVAVENGASLLDAVCRLAERRFPGGGWC